jgi:hypothetical protein
MLQKHLNNHCGVLPLCKSVLLKALRFMLPEGNLHHLGQNRVLRRCLDTNEATTILTELHKEVGGGHFTTKIIV